MEKDILNIQTTMFEIKAALLNNGDIRKLLYYDIPEALEADVTPSINDLTKDANNKDLHYITLFPIMEKGIVEYGRNTYIMITLPLIDLDTDEDNNIYPGITVTAITDSEHYMLSNDRLRLLEICNRVIKILDNQKFTVAGKLEVIQLKEIVFNEQIYGYTLKVFSSDMGKGVGF